MHTVATVTAMGNKELFQTYDEVRSKHPKELKVRVKIGAGSGKKSVLDVLVAFMTKRANLFGVSAVTAGVNVNQAKLDKKIQELMDKLQAQEDKLQAQEDKAVEDAKTITKLLDDAKTNAKTSKVVKNTGGTSGIIDSVIFVDGGSDDAALRQEAIRLIGEALTFTPGPADATTGVLWSTFSSGQKRLFILGKAVAMRAAIVATNSTANGGNVAVNGALLKRFDAVVKLWEDKVDPVVVHKTKKRKVSSANIVSSAEEDSDDDEEFAEKLGRAQRGNGKDFRKDLKDLVNGKGDVPQTADALLERFQKLVAEVKTYSTEFGMTPIEGAPRETEITLRFVEMIQEGAVTIAKLMGDRPNKTGECAEGSVNITEVWQALTSQFLQLTQAVELMKVFFKTIHETSYSEAMELFKTFEPEWNLQRSTTSIRSVISSNVGRSVTKIRAAVNKRSVQGNVLPVKKQKFENSAGTSSSQVSGKTSKGKDFQKCFNCGLMGHVQADCVFSKKSGVSSKAPPQKIPNFLDTHYWDAAKNDWVKK